MNEKQLLAYIFIDPITKESTSIEAISPEEALKKYKELIEDKKQKEKAKDKKLTDK